MARRRSSAAGSSPSGGREPREQELVELDLDLAALGDLERRLDRPGPTRERLLHLSRALEEELVGVEPKLRLLDRRLRLHAEKRRVVRVVLPAQVMDVGGRDERTAELAGDPHDSLVGLVLLGEPVRLDLEVDVVGAEDPDQVVDVGPRVVWAGPRSAAGRTATAGTRSARSPRRSGGRAARSPRWACRARSPPGTPARSSGRGCEIRRPRPPAA